MHHVLLPVDTDEDRALSAARVVTEFPAAPTDVEVTVFNVEKRISETDTGGQVDSETWFDPEDYPESATAVESLLSDAGITVTKRREHADPATAILEAAEELGVDQIVMAGRKRTPVGKALFGSVTQSILLGADVPVTIAPQ